MTKYISTITFWFRIINEYSSSSIKPQFVGQTSRVPPRGHHGDISHTRASGTLSHTHTHTHTTTAIRLNNLKTLKTTIQKNISQG